jgi:hypothetical protein
MVPRGKDAPETLDIVQDQPHRFWTQPYSQKTLAQVNSEHSFSFVWYCLKRFQLLGGRLVFCFLPGRWRQL